jgi:hypothetical protein
MSVLSEDEHKAWEAEEETFNRVGLPILQYIQAHQHQLPVACLQLGNIIIRGQQILEKPREERNFQLYVNLMTSATYLINIFVATI